MNNNGKVGKYLTVINWYTRKSVPFKIEPDGEINIQSSNPEDTEDSCIVVVGDTFYEHSIDLKIVGKL